MNFEEYFYYDETSPSCLRWKVSRYAKPCHKTPLVVKGDCAGTYHKKSGYYRLSIDGRKFAAHRVVMYLHYGYSDLPCDHKDGNRANNRKDNLRYVTTSLNRQNYGLSPLNTSGVTGVARRTISCPKSKKPYDYYFASWTCDGRRRHKAFSIAKMGEECAYSEAHAYRAKKIEELNLQGAGYTENHGIRESH